MAAATDYLKHMRSLRTHINDYEERSMLVKARVEEEKTEIRGLQSELQKVLEATQQAEEDHRGTAQEAGSISMRILESQRRATMLDSDSAALQQALEHVQEENKNISCLMQEMRKEYDAIRKESKAQIAAYEAFYKERRTADA